MEELLLELNEKVGPEHTAMLVVDVQNDFCGPGGYYDRTGADIEGIQRMVLKLQRFLPEARSSGIQIIFVQSIYDGIYLSPVQKERLIRRFGSVVPCCYKGTWGADFYEVRPQSGETIVQKHRYSAFKGTELNILLRSQGIKTLVLTGVATNVCVESTARDGFMHDYYIVVVEDCTAARSESFHRSALANIEGHFGVVVPADSLVGIWSKKSQALPLASFTG